MKVSVITSVFNNKSYIEDCIKCILNQTYKNIEYIIIDGGSTDGTIEIIRKYENKITKWISEPDNGIYDALNKGIRMATGDIIGFLHADDVYAHNKVIETVVSNMKKHNVDSCYGDLLYVDKNNTDKIIRYWKSQPYRDGLFKKGWMPPHPTFFVKKMIYDKYGSFNTDFKIAADYELMLRFLEKYKISTYYIPEVLIKMRIGGASNRSLKNLITKTTEDYRAWKVNNLKRSFYTIPFKNLSKIPQFFKRR
jgi:glycosyltransferase involved in cell wall biosynthesis